MALHLCKQRPRISSFFNQAVIDSRSHTGDCQLILEPEAHRCRHAGEVQPTRMRLHRASGGFQAGLPGSNYFVWVSAITCIKPGFQLGHQSLVIG